jgi:hypothetical protein
MNNNHSLLCIEHKISESIQPKKNKSIIIIIHRYIINGLIAPGEPEFGRNNRSRSLNQIKNRLCWLLVMTFFQKTAPKFFFRLWKQTTKKRDRWNSATLRHSTRAHHLTVRHAYHRMFNMMHDLFHWFHSFNSLGRGFYLRSQ